MFANPTDASPEMLETVEVLFFVWQGGANADYNTRSFKDENHARRWARVCGGMVYAVCADGTVRHL